MDTKKFLLYGANDYTGMAHKVDKLLKFQFLFNWLLLTSFISNRQINKIKSQPSGPSERDHFF